MESIGVRELRQHASRWLARVAKGDSFEITDRGRPVAALVPLTAGRWERLVAEGSVRAATGSLLDVVPLPAGSRPLSALVDEDRSESS
jgi:prevent-host-death family protein